MPDRRSIPPPPADLSEPIDGLWPGLVADVRATGDGAEVDLILLEELLRTMDRLAQVRAALATDGLTVAGSKAQKRPHPLLAMESALQGRVSLGLRGLGLAQSHRSYGLRVDRDGRLVKRT